MAAVTTIIKIQPSPFLDRLLIPRIRVQLLWLCLILSREKAKLPTEHKTDSQDPNDADSPHCPPPKRRVLLHRELPLLFLFTEVPLGDEDDNDNDVLKCLILRSSRSLRREHGYPVLLKDMFDLGLLLLQHFL